MEELRPKDIEELLDELQEEEVEAELEAEGDAPPPADEAAQLVLREHGHAGYLAPARRQILLQTGRRYERRGSPTELVGCGVNGDLFAVPPPGHFLAQAERIEPVQAKLPVLLSVGAVKRHQDGVPGRIGHKHVGRHQRPGACDGPALAVRAGIGGLERPSLL